MTCFEKEQLFAYAHHMLQGGEAGRVEKHLASCAECRKITDAFKKLDVVLGEWKPVEPSPWFDAHARARIAAEARPRRLLPRLSWRAWSGVAAVAVLAIVAGVAALRPPRSTHKAPMMETAAVKTAVKPSAASGAPRPAALEQTAGTGETSAIAQSQPANQEIDLYKNLNVLENYDMLANFDVLSEIPQAGGSASD
ncbi:MAG: zf-HC2 domain-containing protein [Terriglobia bacterium]